MKNRNGCIDCAKTVIRSILEPNEYQEIVLRIDVLVKVTENKQELEKSIVQLLYFLLVTRAEYPKHLPKMFGYFPQTPISNPQVVGRSLRIPQKHRQIMWMDDDVFWTRIDYKEDKAWVRIIGYDEDPKHRLTIRLPIWWSRILQ